MAPFQKNIAEIQTKLQGVLGKKAWGVEHGIGTIVTMEFGQPLPAKDPHVHGMRNEVVTREQGKSSI